MEASPTTHLGTPAVLTVDLWYTLIYQNPEERRGYERSRRAAWRDALHALGMGAAESSRWARAVDVRGSTSEAAWIEDRVRWLREQTRREVDVTPLRRALDRAADEAAIRVVPGTRTFLREATSRGIRIGLVSNITHESPGAVYRMLDRTGLAPWFTVVALSNESGLVKPDPAVWRDVWRRLGVRRGPVVHIGDTEADTNGVPGPTGTAWLFTGAARWAPLRERRRQARIDPSVPRFSSWRQVSAQLFAGQVPRKGPRRRPR
jgi:FMN phosphatase YigB (HAD superfamily)